MREFTDEETAVIADENELLLRQNVDLLKENAMLKEALYGKVREYLIEPLLTTNTTSMTEVKESNIASS
jgi:hypothetical protein